MFVQTNALLKLISDPERQDDRGKWNPRYKELVTYTYKFSLGVYLANIVMSILVGYAAYKRERTLLIIWLYYDAIYIPISAVNMIGMFDWGSATMFFNIYFWVLVFELKRKLRDAYYWKTAILECNAQD